MKYLFVELPTIIGICLIFLLPIFYYNYKKQMKRKREVLGDDLSMEEEESYEAIAECVIN